MQDVPVHHLGVDGHERPQVDVEAARVQTHQRQDVEEELGPQGQVLHDEREGQHLSRFVPDEGLLGLTADQLQDDRQHGISLREPKLRFLALELRP